MGRSLGNEVWSNLVQTVLSQGHFRSRLPNSFLLQDQEATILRVITSSEPRMMA